MKNDGKKVYVGLSGGVDSSVSALLLLQQGYEVEGVFIRTWQPDWTPCTWRQDRRDAMRICAKLDIKYNELDLEKEYKEQVADYMISEYRLGRTPNPDVMCNRAVKFGGFLDWALAQGADYVATGHYATVLETETGSVLGKGADPGKDQSYFLWTLKSDQLDHILFPVGHMQKSQVRDIALKNDLITANKKDSQGICFLGDIDMREFLGHYIEDKPGNVLNEAGEVIGHHDGAVFFTLGQRHGFTITTHGVDDAPRYIVKKDIDNNTVTVSSNILKKSQTRQVELTSVNQIHKPAFQIGVNLSSAIRYHGKLQDCKIVGKSDESLYVEFTEFDPTLAAGQSVVFYENDFCLGGGIVSG